MLLSIELMGDIKATVSAPTRGSWLALKNVGGTGPRQADGLLT